MKTLRDAGVGQTVTVAKVHGEGPVRRRIMDMGLTKGVQVLVRKNGDRIDLAKLSRELGCEVIGISALKGEGSAKAAEMAVAAARDGKAGELPHVFTGSVEHALAHIACPGPY